MAGGARPGARVRGPEDAASRGFDLTDYDESMIQIIKTGFGVLCGNWLRRSEDYRSWL